MNVLRLLARGGAPPGIPGSAGTIYLKDSAEPTGDVIIDNGGVGSGLGTLPITGLASFRDVTIRYETKTLLAPGVDESTEDSRTGSAFHRGVAELWRQAFFGEPARD